MSRAIAFTVLIERRRLTQMLGLLLMTMALLASIFGPRGAHAQTAALDKVALDLRVVISLPTTPTLSWVKATAWSRC